MSKLKGKSRYFARTEIWNRNFNIKERDGWFFAIFVREHPKVASITYLDWVVHVHMLLPSAAKYCLIGVFQFIYIFVRGGWQLQVVIHRYFEHMHWFSATVASHKMNHSCARLVLLCATYSTQGASAIFVIFYYLISPMHFNFFVRGKTEMQLICIICDDALSYAA